VVGRVSDSGKKAFAHRGLVQQLKGNSEASAISVVLDEQDAKDMNRVIPDTPKEWSLMFTDVFELLHYKGFTKSEV